MNRTTIYREPETAKAPEIEIHYKTAVRPAQRPQIQNAPDVYNIMTENGEMSRNMEYKEMFFALYLNQANKLLALHKIGEGTTTAAPVDVKFIMQGAIMTNAAALIVCHNHPSGSTSPSRNDKLTDGQDTESRRTFRHPTDRQRDNNRRQLFFIR
jgi:DNA repair proteins